MRRAAALVAWALLVSPGAVALVLPHDVIGLTGGPWLAWRTQPVHEGARPGHGFALDAAGHPHTLALAIPDAHHSWTDGLTWHDEVVPLGVAAGSYHALAYDAAGFLHAALTTNDQDASGAKLVYGTRGASGWIFETVDATARSLTAGIEARLAFDPSGAPHLAYINELPGLAGALTHAWRDAGGWHVERLDAGAGADQCMAIDGAGALHVAYTKIVGGALREAYARRAPGGGWTFGTIDAGAGGACGIAVAPDGAVHVSYRGAASHVRHATLAGSTWTSEEVSTLEAASNDLQIDRVGRVHVALWELPDAADANLPTAGHLHLAHRDAAGSWTTEIVDAQIAGESVKLRLDAQDRPHLAYLHAHDAFADVVDRPLTLMLAEPVGVVVAALDGVLP